MSVLSNLKSLTILRHAKTHSHSESGRDFDRILQSAGETEAAAIGQHWSAQNFSIDKILASTAARVKGTLAHFQPAAGLATLEPQWETDIYLASAHTLGKLVLERGGDAEHILVCGHNPGLTELLLLLLADGELRQSPPAPPYPIAHAIPTATIARIACTAETIRDSLANKPADGKLTYFCSPRDLISKLNLQTELETSRFSESSNGRR